MKINKAASRYTTEDEVGKLLADALAALSNIANNHIINEMIYDGGKILVFTEDGEFEIEL